MQRKSRRLFISILATLPLLGGCEGDVTRPGGDAVTAVQLLPAVFSLIVGESKVIDVRPKNGNGTVLAGRAMEWNNAAPQVVSVDDAGVVTALAEGEVSLVVTVEGVSATAEVTVLPPPVGEWREHTCAVTLARQVYCWGLGLNGQIGNGDGATAFVPTRIEVEGSRTWLSVASGAGHSCALEADGTISCWGRGAEGQLGRGTLEGSTSPVRVDSNFLYRTVTAGGRHSCAISAQTDALHCWGWNDGGQLGNDTRVTLQRPVEIEGGISFGDVSAGTRHTCGVALDGGLWCWGDNAHGQLGVPGIEESLTPVRVDHPTGFVAVSAGVRHTCAVDDTGSAYCWGDNTAGQLGDRTRESRQAPVAVHGGLELATVSAGAVHTCAVATDQRAYCWGLGTLGRLATHREILIAQPVEVGGGAVYRDIYAGLSHGCAITFADTMKCWGFGGFGQLGTGSPDRSNQPVDPVSSVFFARFR